MKKWVVTNWKMNGSLNLLSEYQQAFEPQKNLIVCPPSIYLNETTEFILGAQNVYQQEKGAYTGEISASMLKDIGIKYCIVGHSERRQYFEETNDMVRAKAEACLKNSITPIVCIGETFEQYQAGKTLEILERQLRECSPSEGDFWVAYEPVWAIGTGCTPTIDEILTVHTYLRVKLPAITLLYGGSVNKSNAGIIFTISNVDGVLVGGASLDINAINHIYQAATHNHLKKENTSSP